MLRIRKRIALFRYRHVDQIARLHEPIDDAGRASGLLRQLRFGSDQPVACDLERALSGRRHARRLARVRHMPHAETRLDGFENGLRAHHHAQHHAERRQRVFRDPLGETHGFCRQRRHIQRLEQRLELFRIGRALAASHARIPHHAYAMLRPERDDIKGAGFGRMSCGDDVVVGLFQRNRQQHGHERLCLVLAFHINAKQTIQLCGRQIRS